MDDRFTAPNLNPVLLNPANSGQSDVRKILNMEGSLLIGIPSFTCFGFQYRPALGGLRPRPQRAMRSDNERIPCWIHQGCQGNPERVCRPCSRHLAIASGGDGILAKGQGSASSVAFDVVLSPANGRAFFARPASVRTRSSFRSVRSPFRPCLPAETHRASFASRSPPQTGGSPWLPAPPKRSVQPRPPADRQG